MTSTAKHLPGCVAVRCVNAVNAEDCLTPGKVYMGLPRDRDGLDGYHLVDDSGAEMWWMASRFRPITPCKPIQPTRLDYDRLLFWIALPIACVFAWALIFDAFTYFANLVAGLLTGTPIDLD